MICNQVIKILKGLQRYDIGSIGVKRNLVNFQANQSHNKKFLACDCHVSRMPNNYRRKK